MSLPNQGPSESQLPVGKALPHKHSVLPRGGFTLPSGGPYKGQRTHFYDKYHWGLRDAVIQNEEDNVKPGVAIKDEDGEEKESAEQIATSTSEHDTTGETLLEDQGEPVTPPKHTSRSTRSPAHPKVASTNLGPFLSNPSGAVPDLSHLPITPEGSTNPVAATTPMSLKKVTRALSTRPRNVVIPGSRTHV